MTVTEILRAIIIAHPNNPSYWSNALNEACSVDRNVYWLQVGLNLSEENKDIKLNDLIGIIFEDFKLPLRVVRKEDNETFITVFGSIDERFLFVQVWKDTEDKISLKVLSDSDQIGPAIMKYSV